MSEAEHATHGTNGTILHTYTHAEWELGKHGYLDVLMFHTCATITA